MFNRLAVLLLAVLLTLPVIAQDDVSATNLTDTCVTEFDASVDYFPEKVSVDYAEGFSVEYFNHYKVVTVTPFVGAETPLTYLLVQCGAPVPQDVAADVTLDVPVERFVAMSTTILPHLEDQDLLDRLVGVDTLLFTANQAVLALEDDLVQIGGGGAGTDINLEVALDLAPDLIMGQQFFGGDTSFDAVRDAGVTVVLNSDFADSTALAQAEWGKYLALFFNTEAAANVTFTDVETQYSELSALAADIPDEERPTVIANTPFSGAWFMPAGDSVLAQLIADAGGDFVFSDLDGTSVQLDFEVVLDQGGEADYWINLNQPWTTLDDALADDTRYAEFAAFEAGELWNNNLLQTPAGGTAYFEEGFVNPHLILADLIAILHPDLLPDHEFVFYQRLTD